MKQIGLYVFSVFILAAVPAAFGQSAWEVEAQQRIEEHRMNTLRVVVQDAEGQPVEGATVEVEMQRHAFGFGTAITAGQFHNDNEPEYREKLTDLTGDGRGFNLAVFGNAMKWPYWESAGDAGRQRRVLDVLWLISRGIDVRGHTLLWPSWGNVPRDLSTNSDDPAYLVDRIEQHVRATVGYQGLQGVLREWDVVNEPTHLHDVRDALQGYDDYGTGEEIYADAFKWAADADPDANLFVNDYNIISNYNTGWQAGERRAYRDVIQDLLDADAPVYGIGMQGHMSPGSATSAENALRVLDEFAAFGLPVSITEYDYAYSQSGAGCQVPGDEAAASHMRDFLTAVFSHPSVESFTIWGFWDGDHWRCYAPLFNQDWTLKPSGEAYVDLVFDQWWTDETVTTDVQGEAVVDAFLGDYEVRVTRDGAVLADEDVVLEQGEAQELIVRLTATSADEVGVIDRFRVEALYPQPTTTRATLVYVLPQPADVTIEVFDLMGRRVQAQATGWQPAGDHELDVEVAELPSAVYVYRLRAGVHSHTGRLYVVR